MCVSLCIWVNGMGMEKGTEVGKIISNKHRYAKLLNDPSEKTYTHSHTQESQPTNTQTKNSFS